MMICTTFSFKMNNVFSSLLFVDVFYKAVVASLGRINVFIFINLRHASP